MSSCTFQLKPTTRDAHLLKLYQRPNDCCQSKNSSFSVTSFQCLGYLVDVNGFRPDPKRLGSLADTQVPKKMSEMRSLLDPPHCYSICTPDFSERVFCLFHLVSRPSFKWSASHKLCVRSSLHFLSYTNVLIINVSPFEVFAAIEQNRKPVICMSHRLRKIGVGYLLT